MELESLFETYKNSVFQKDVNAFVSIFDEQVQIFDMWAWAYEGLVAWREMATGWFGSLGTERVVVQFDDIQVQATGEMGYATANVRFAAISESGQELRYLQNRLTWVAQKKEGVWKIIHEHTSGPVDHVTLKVILKKEK